MFLFIGFSSFEHAYVGTRDNVVRSGEANESGEVLGFGKRAKAKRCDDKAKQRLIVLVYGYGKAE